MAVHDLARRRPHHRRSHRRRLGETSILPPIPTKKTLPRPRLGRLDTNVYHARVDEDLHLPLSSENRRYEEIARGVVGHGGILGAVYGGVCGVVFGDLFSDEGVLECYAPGEVYE